MPVSPEPASASARIPLHPKYVKSERLGRRKCGIGMNAGREKVRVANALPHLPKVSARYSKGEISYSKVRAITRIATPENEEYLLMIARHGTAAHVEGLVRKGKGWTGRWR